MYCGKQYFSIEQWSFDFSMKQIAQSKFNLLDPHQNSHKNIEWQNIHEPTKNIAIYFMMSFCNNELKKLYVMNRTSYGV